MAEVADGRDLVGLPAQPDEIFRALTRRVGIEHQNSGMALNQPRHQMPVADPGIVYKISGRNLGLAVQTRLVDELEPYVVGNHGADGVEIPRIEMRDISRKR